MNQPPEFYNNNWDLWFLPYRSGQTLFAGDEVQHPDLLGKAPPALSEAVSLHRYFLSFSQLIKAFVFAQERAARAQRDAERAARLQRGAAAAAKIKRPPPTSPSPAYAPQDASQPPGDVLSFRRRTPLFLSSPSSTPPAPMEISAPEPEPEVAELPPALEPTPRTQVLEERVSLSYFSFMLFQH